jgi:hypothetical protein
MQSTDTQSSFVVQWANITSFSVVLDTDYASRRRRALSTPSSSTCLVKQYNTSTTSGQSAAGSTYVNLTTADVLWKCSVPSGTSKSHLELVNNYGEVISIPCFGVHDFGSDRHSILIGHGA